MNKDQAKIIWDNYLQGKASNEEKQLIESWYNHIATQQHSSVDSINWDAIETELANRLPLAPIRPERKVIKLRYISVAAAMLLFAIGITFYLRTPEVKPIPKEMVNQVIVSGGKKATLKLAGGQLITLNEEKDAVILRDGKNYYADGTLVAGDRENTPKNAVQNLELSIPNGGEYQVVLSDGTKVWLNSSSTLKYPSSFSTSEERIVELAGEAYFEVKPDPQKPFKVKSQGQIIRVLGTHFNVNAYADEPAIKTTLLEGKVAVNLPSGETKNLAPGQQSVVQAQSGNIQVRSVDPVEAIDWKNGDFVFDNVTIETIMRKIARWYDVDVLFKGKMSTTIFYGEISRSKKITEVLQLLEGTDAVHFKYEKTENIGRGRRIVVMP